MSKTIPLREKCECDNGVCEGGGVTGIDNESPFQGTSQVTILSSPR